MDYTPKTEMLLAKLESASGNQLIWKSDLGLLIDIANRHDKVVTLDELSFFAKFAHKTYGIMKRIGREGEGYDKLSQEFRNSLEKIRALADVLVQQATVTSQESFRKRFLAMTPESLQNLLSLLHDLSWYKNHSIDQKAE